MKLVDAHNFLVVLNLRFFKMFLSSIEGIVCYLNKKTLFLSLGSLEKSIFKPQFLKN